MATLAELLKASLRKSGITRHPGTTPSTDEYAELIPEMNRMLASWSINALDIYSIDISIWPLTGAISYTMGPTGNFNYTVRPAVIKTAVILLNGGPVRLPPMYLTTESSEWAGISLQAVPGCIPLFLYNDQDYPLSNLYLWPQDTGGDTLELDTWVPLQSFTATTDTVVLPPGYEDAIVNNFALRVAGLYPGEAVISDDTRRLAGESLQMVQSRNSGIPKMTTDAPGVISRGGAGGSGYFDWRTGFVNR